MGQVNKNLVSHSDHNFALFRFNDQGQICLDDYVIPWVTHFEMQNFAKGTAQLNLEIIVRLDKEMTLHEAENQSNNFNALWCFTPCNPFLQPAVRFPL